MSTLAPLLGAAEAELSNFDLSLLDEPIVPTELFFVREHFPAPRVSSAGWKLSIAGTVVNTRELSLDDLIALPKKVLPVTIECAENPVGGGLVSHAEWTGVPLSLLLERAQPASESGSVRLSGADGFSRAIPLAKAMHPDTLIAYSINGDKLPANHGFPMRAIVPGWYGMDSVKWLNRIEVGPPDNATPLRPEPYVRVTRSLLTGPRPAGRVAAMNVKSAFTRPVDGAILKGRRFIVRGAAWAGENRIRTVEVATDGAKSWHIARLNADPQPYTWALWEFEWKIASAGQYEIAVRAGDEQGHTQPAERASDRADGYEHNSYQHIRVTVV